MKKRYKNIELADELKKVEMINFHFNVHIDENITFEIHYKEDVLLEVFPEARTRVSRAVRAAAKSSMKQPAEDEATEAMEPETEVKDETEDSHPADISQIEVTDEATSENSKPKGLEAAYNVTGIRRKELMAAISNFTGADPAYLRTPIYAFAVGNYNIEEKEL